MIFTVVWLVKPSSMIHRESEILMLLRRQLLVLLNLCPSSQLVQQLEHRSLYLADPRELPSAGALLADGVQLVDEDDSRRFPQRPRLDSLRDVFRRSYL